MARYRVLQGIDYPPNKRASAAIFARPCSAASRGCETCPRFPVLATFPGDSPA